jgi:hypothetical protein
MGEEAAVGDGEQFQIVNSNDSLTYLYDGEVASDTIRDGLPGGLLSVVYWGWIFVK